MSEEEMKVLSPGEAAELLCVSPKTIGRWCRQGKMRHLTTIGGHRRIPVMEVARLMLEQGRTPKETMDALLGDDD